LSTRMLYEAYSMARAVEVTCGEAPGLREALEALEEALDYPVGREDLEWVASLLRGAADALRARGCLEWYLLEQAADTLEHI